MGAQRPAFALFIVLSLFAALTEGLGISLFIPILDVQANGGAFAKVPLLSLLNEMFSSFQAEQKIKALAVVLALVVITRGLLQYTVTVMAALIPQALHHRFCMETYRDLLGVTIGWVHDRDAGTLLSGLGPWQQRATMLITDVATVVAALFLLAIYTAMMLLVSWKLTLGAGAFLAVISLVIRVSVSNGLRRAGRETTEATNRLNSITHQTLLGLKLVRLSAAAEFMCDYYERTLSQMLSAHRRAILIGNLSGPFLTTMAGIFICLLLFVLAGVNGSSMSWLSEMLMFLLLLTRLLSPITVLHLARGRILKDLNALENLEVLQAELLRNREPSGATRAERFRGEIRFDSVTFTYSGKKPVIDDFSLTIPRGSMVALVGPSGAGKSTILSLLVRLFDPQSGCIRVDGADLRDFDVESWRRLISVVSQDIFIFNDSVHNNICFGRPDATREEVEAAARMAAADEFIKQLPKGYDTELGDRGLRLSGGQQQRIAIARAVLADPDILILDEATSHLDTVTEQAIQQAVEKLSVDRTVIIVAHRLSTVRKADMVVVMRDGRIVETGCHRDLIAASGLYAELVAQQTLEPDNSDESS